ncbi:MAG: AbrB/MazE/SpoVT family DNA-binding domain-containing protein, partial [Thermoproteota archaeon]
MTKFIRRLQRIGSSILVSLPKEWIVTNNLDKGSQVELETGQDTVSISANKEMRPTKELVIS